LRRGPGAGPVEARLLRSPRVVDAAREQGPEGLVSVVGIKYTTGLTVGARAVDLAAAKLGQAPPAQAGPPRAEPESPAAPAGLDPALATRLSATYGAPAAAIFRDLAANGVHARRIVAGQPTTAARSCTRCGRRWRRRWRTSCCRRTPLGTCGHPGAAALAACAAIIGDELGWNAARRVREIGLVEAHYRRFTGREAP